MRGEVYILETDMFDTSHGGDVASGCAVNRTPRQALYRRKKFEYKEIKEKRTSGRFEVLEFNCPAWSCLM